MEAYLRGSLEGVRSKRVDRNLSANECRFMALLRMKSTPGLTG